MDFTIKIDPSAGALIAGLAKLIVDVDAAALKAGHPTGSAEYLALLQVAIADLGGVITNSAAGLAAFKAKPYDCAAALAIQIVNSAGV